MLVAIDARDDEILLLLSKAEKEIFPSYRNSMEAKENKVFRFRYVCQNN